MENTETQGFSFELPKGNSSIIKVIGVGGGGNNALKYMYERGILGVDFIVCNTDSQALDNNPVSNKVQLGLSMTEGLGAGADPEVGEKAAIESIDDIKAALGQNTKMVFITAGMGGGTGTGAAPVIAKIAKEMGILTIGIVTVPFSFEGKRRLEQAENGLEKLKNNVDSLIVINNDKLRQLFGNLGFKQGFSKADEVLTNAAKGMAEVITGYFDVNIDFRDAKSVLQNSGTALMSTGIASGENKAEEAVKKALDSPLLNDNKIKGAKNVLLLIRSGNEEATMDEIGLINDYIQKEAGNTADIIFGVGADEELGDAISVLVIATGFSKDNMKLSGATEKIKIKLNEEVKESNKAVNSPIESRPSKEQTPQNSLFTLEETPVSTQEIKAAYQEEYKQVYQNPVSDFHYEDDAKEEIEERPIDLFSYADMEEEPITFSFNIDEEERVEEKTEEATPEMETTPLLGEIAFSINDTIEEKEFNAIKEEQDIVLENKADIIDMESKLPETQAETKKENDTVEGDENEFTFIEKSTSRDQKILERRNKLKEFNSRYQVIENENDFERQPAYKRKNIQIDNMNASEQNTSSFLSENENGEIKVRENRFLNKDTD